MLTKGHAHGRERNLAAVATGPSRLRFSRCQADASGAWQPAHARRGGQGSAFPARCHTIRQFKLLAFATVDGDGNPQVRNISAIHYEPDAIYFFTARGKDFYKELVDTGKVQILGYTMYKEMIRLTGRAKPVRKDEQEKWADIIFAGQPYLANVYPGDTRKIGVIFCIRDMEIEYFNLGVNPIFRESYAIGNAKISQKGYCITEDCIGCGKCVKVCLQRAIEKGKPGMIHQEHCLHCGNCFENCPVSAIKHRAYCMEE